MVHISPRSGQLFSCYQKSSGSVKPRWFHLPPQPETVCGGGWLGKKSQVEGEGRTDTSSGWFFLGLENPDNLPFFLFSFF